MVRCAECWEPASLWLVVGDDCPRPMCDGIMEVAACAYCKAESTEERKGEPVCENCAEDFRRGDERQRREDAREYAADQAYSEWKDERR